VDLRSAGLYHGAQGDSRRRAKRQNPDMKITRHLRIDGRVQGVGYRAALCAEAGSCGIAGWVRNRRDGSVEAVVQGSPEAVEMLLAWARRGPPAAKVRDVGAQPATGEFDRPYHGFEQLPTA
jgi:acylphosphatase